MSRFLKRFKVSILILLTGILIGGYGFHSLFAQIHEIIGASVSYPSSVTLSVVFAGSGAGTVTSGDGLVNCSSNCSTVFVSGATVILTATPSTGSIFTGWSGSGCSGTGTCTIVMTENREVTATFWTPPGGAAIWAWYRTLEGSGTAITDYSGVGAAALCTTNLAVCPATAAQQNYFWNTNPGFGTGNSTNTSGAITRTAPARGTDYCSLVAFIKPLGSGFFNSRDAIQLGETALGQIIRVGWNAPTNQFVTITLASGTFVSGTYSVTYGTWYCYYAFCQRNTVNTGVYIRKSGDAGWTLARGGDFPGNTTQAQLRPTFCAGNNNGIDMVGGDALYYALNTSGGIISLANATEIFNTLKSRYGML